MFLASPTQDGVYTGVRAFLLSILPPGVEVVVGQENRVPQPSAPDHVVIWPLFRSRLSTNIKSEGDSKYVGSISGTTMTVTDVSIGGLTAGNWVFGVGILPGTKIEAVLTGIGGIGTYQISPSQNLSSQVLSSGASGIIQPTEIVLQIDVHGPSSADNSQVVTTLLRDEYACTWFADNGYAISTLYADDRNQAPFDNAENQVEEKWSITAHLQANILTFVPQQYADSVAVDLINVDAVYPP